MYNDNVSSKAELMLLHMISVITTKKTSLVLTRKGLFTYKHMLNSENLNFRIASFIITECVGGKLHLILMMGAYNLKPIDAIVFIKNAVDKLKSGVIR